MSTITWAKPMELEFDILGEPKQRVMAIMPLWNEIPEDFRKERGEGKKYTQVVDDWFFKGMRMIHVVPKHGIDKGKAMRHLRVIMQSWEPQHEHKTAAVAWLMSLWFEKFEYEVAK